MICAERRTEINAGLARVAEDEGVRVLYACESGSRAWGFPSRDSDYDVRFIWLSHGPLRVGGVVPRGGPDLVPHLGDQVRR